VKRKTSIIGNPARYSRDPEFVDSYGLKVGFGISRSLAYVLAQAGLIQSVSIRRPGTARGKRLWRVSSVRRYLNELERKQRASKPAHMEIVEDSAQ
jgi:hypothetical protein